MGTRKSFPHTSTAGMPWRSLLGIQTVYNAYTFFAQGTVDSNVIHQ